MVFPLLGNKRFLSIDLGSLNIKIIEAVLKKEKLEIINFGLIPIFSYRDFSLSSYILEENIAGIIDSFLKESKMKTKKAFFNVLSPYVFYSNFLIPNIPEKSLPQVIKFESQKQVPLPLDEVEIEYRYLQFETEDNKQWLVFLSAIPKNYLKKLENLARLSQLKNLGHSPEQFNLEPYFASKPGIYLIVDFGHSLSSVFLVKEGKVIYANKLRIKIYDLIGSIIKILQFSEEDVFDFLKKTGFLINPEDQEVKYLIDDFVNNFTRSIQEEILKIENNFLLRIEKIYWTGGGCLFPGFEEVLLPKLSNYQQEILSLTNFVLGEKFLSLKEKTTIFSQAVGLLLRKVK